MQKIELVIAVLGICAIGAIFYVVLKAALA